MTKMYHFDDIEKYYELFVIFSQFCFISGPNEPKCNLQREVHEMKANKSLFAVFFVSPANNTFFVYFGYFSFVSALNTCSDTDVYFGYIVSDTCLY